MGYVGKVTAGGSTHLVGSTLYGTCATAAATAAKVVTCADFTTLITGVTIHVKFTYANSVANPTLNVNSTGAKSIYRYGTTAPSTSAASSWQAGSVVEFTYDGSAWIMNGWLNNNDNDYDRAVVNRAVKAAAAVTAGQIIVGTSAGYKPATSGVTFDISYPILWASAAIASGATATNTYHYYTAVDLTKTKSGYAGTTYSTVYLVCSSLDGNLAIVHSNIFSSTQPTSPDGLYYIPLGLLYSSAACYFYPINKIFRYANGKFTEVGSEPCVMHYLGDTSTQVYLDIYDREVSILNPMDPASGVTFDVYAEPGDVVQLLVNNVLKQYVWTPEGMWRVLGEQSGLPEHIVTGTGTSGYLAKFTSSGSIGNGPQLGTSTTTYLKNDGSWGTPPNNNVLQSEVSTAANYEVLFSSSEGNTTKTESANKSEKLKFNPNTGNLQVTQINGVTVGTSPKFTDNNTTYGLSISDHTVSLVAGGTTSSVTVPDNNTTYGLSISGHTVSLVSGGTTSSVTVPDNNNYDRANLNRAVKAAAAVTAGSVIVGTSSGYKTAASGVTFDTSYPILWASAAISSGSTASNTYLYYTSVDLTKTKASWTGTNNSTVYLVCSAISGNTATIDSAVITTTKPTAMDNKFYIPIGLMYSTTACYFYPINKMFMYYNGGFNEFNPGKIISGQLSYGSITVASNATTDYDIHSLLTTAVNSISPYKVWSLMPYFNQNKFSTSVYLDSSSHWHIVVHNFYTSSLTATMTVRFLYSIG